MSAQPGKQDRLRELESQLRRANARIAELEAAGPGPQLAKLDTLVDKIVSHARAPAEPLPPGEVVVIEEPKRKRGRK